MNTKKLGILVLIVVTVGTCLWTLNNRGMSGIEEQELTLPIPFRLDAFLKENIEDFNHNEVAFRIKDQAGNPVPYALFKMEWSDNGGRMSFQADEKGTITMHFAENMLDSEITVSVDTKPRGQILLESADYDESSQPLVAGEIHAIW